MSGNSQFKILLVGRGEQHHLGNYFKNALTNLELNFEFFDETKYYRGIYSSYFQRLLFHLLGKPGTYRELNSDLFKAIYHHKPQLVFVCKGSYISSKLIERSRELGGILWVNYAPDDPFNQNINHRNLLKTIPLYDFFFSTKRANISDLKGLGCNNVYYVPFGYDPLVHYKETPINESEKIKFANDIVFIGAADKNRYFIYNFYKKSPYINITFFGSNWGKYIPNSKIQPIYGRDYRLAVNGAKINLGLIRHENRDGHSMRSFEIPACGGFMISERTEEHKEIFIEDRDVVFFDSQIELESKILFYLKNDGVRERIKRNGSQKILAGHHQYIDRMKQILNIVNI